MSRHEEPIDRLAVLRRLSSLAVLVVAAACGGGGGGTSPTSATPAATPTPAPTPVPAAFGPGQVLVNSRIAPGRYFADPSGGGCYWERQSGTGGTLDEIIANDIFLFDPRQVIVDILPSDVAFKSETECGSWYSTPRQPAQTSIGPGVWLVGAQIPPGTYQVAAGDGCYWERLRDFQGGIDSIIANDFVDGGGSRTVTIGAGDVGFRNDSDCGTWTRSASAAETALVPGRSAADIAAARGRYDRKRGLRR